MSILSDKARAFLAEPRFAVLATNSQGGAPHLTVMWYAIDGDEVLMNTKVGRVKDQNLRRDPHIAICVEDGYNYVTLNGHSYLIEDQAIAQADIKRLAIRYHGIEKGERMARELFAKEQRITVRMRIEQVLERL